MLWITLIPFRRPQVESSIWDNEYHLIKSQSLKQFFSYNKLLMNIDYIRHFVLLLFYYLWIKLIVLTLLNSLRRTYFVLLKMSLWFSSLIVYINLSSWISSDDWIKLSHPYLSTLFNLCLIFVFIFIYILILILIFIFGNFYRIHLRFSIHLLGFKLWGLYSVLDISLKVIVINCGLYFFDYIF